MELLEILKVTEIVLAIFLIAIVLIQNKNVSLNLSSMSGGMGAITKRWPEKVLHNTTIIIGGFFILNSLLLFIIQ